MRERARWGRTGSRRLRERMQDWVERSKGWFRRNGRRHARLSNTREVDTMAALMRWEPQGVNRLRQDMDELFEQFFEREDWMPTRMFRSLRSFQDEMDDLFGSFFGSDWGVVGTATTPRVESSVKDNHLVLRAEVPGYGPDEVKVNLTGDTLQIEAEHQSKDGDRQEQRRFSYRYTLPEPVNPENVKANLTHGVLEIQVPVSPKLTGRQIPIQIGAGSDPKQLKAA